MIKQTKLRYPIITFIPVLLVAVMIFGFSSQNADESESLSRTIAYMIIDRVDTSSMNENEFEEFEQHVIHIVRKTAHFLEYTAFGFFLALHLSTFIKKFSWLIAAAISLFYAMSDEFHQLFVENRTMQFADVCIDFLGAVTGVAAMSMLLFVVYKARTNRIQYDKRT